MKKVKEKDLVIGDEYIDTEVKTQQSKLIYVGMFYDSECEKSYLYFYPTFNFGYKTTNDGTIAFERYQSFFMYEEVE